MSESCMGSTVPLLRDNSDEGPFCDEEGPCSKLNCDYKCRLYIWKRNVNENVWKWKNRNHYEKADLVKLYINLNFKLIYPKFKGYFIYLQADLERCSMLLPHRPKASRDQLCRYQRVRKQCLRSDLPGRKSLFLYSFSVLHPICSFFRTL